MSESVERVNFESETAVAGTTTEQSQSKYNFGEIPFNTVAIESGLSIDGVKITGLKDVDIKSGVDIYSEVTISFYAKIKGLDNL